MPRDDKQPTPQEPQGILMHGYLNIYRSGFFHRENKPNGFDRHAGDIYDSLEQALKEIDPPSHYVATVPVSWYDTEQGAVNPADAIPVPLRESRRKTTQAMHPTHPITA